VVSVLLSVPIPGTSRETQLREERKMAKLDESEGEVLSREEMKNTKGGAGAAAAAEAEAGLRARVLDTSLQEDALNISAVPPVAGAKPPPIPTK
jgi:hypothetical protein